MKEEFPQFAQRMENEANNAPIDSQTSTIDKSTENQHLGMCSDGILLIVISEILNLKCTAYYSSENRN